MFSDIFYNWIFSNITTRVTSLLTNKIFLRDKMDIFFVHNLNPKINDGLLKTPKYTTHIKLFSQEYVKKKLHRNKMGGIIY